MAKNRKCILCETVHVSRQEIEEHMRSMLHHRELEKLKGRDCGHECRVCKVTVVSLTDYASHISSPMHKQNVEDAERKPIRNGRDEDYFDQTLVDLIEKRNEQIRKEKEAAAAKLAKEEEERKRKEEFQLRLKEAKERFQPEWPQQSNSGGHQHGSWYKGKRYNTNPGYTQNFRPWDQSNWGKGATWHAQQPPNFKQFSGEFSNKDQDNQWKQGSFYGKKVRPPWISSTGSSNGVYGCNNISQYSQNVRPVTLFGAPPPPLFPSLPNFFAQGQKQIQNPANKQRGQQRDGFKNGEKQSTEADHHSSKSSKTFGSNPKLDKTCRWSPYPVTKGSESTPNLAEKTPSVQKPQKLKKTPESSALNTQTRPGQSSSSGKGNSNSRSNSLQKEGHKNPSPSPSSQRANKPAQRTERRQSSGTGVSGGAQLNKVSSQTSEKLKPSSKNSLSSQSSGSLQSKSERQLPETLKKTRPLEKRSSLENLSNAGQNTVEDQRHTGVNKENNVRQNQAKPSVTDSLKPALKEKDRLPSSDSYQSLQLLQVSTSAESSHSTIPIQEDEENEKKMKETCVDKTVQSGEAAQCSESDNPKSDDAASQSSGLSKLDLPPVLKRDLTKHISSKVKTGSHEPNLNIARRVRNLSGSRKSDPEKDSGPKPTVLKPTVQQLISGSGSRRNVNWEQVYHEVKKKQDKGKGMPRFGIEMVSLDQEDQIQEEDDFSLTQGFHWDSLMDVPTPPTSRKRSLSESSIAPGPAHTPFQSDITPGLRFSPSYVQNDDPHQEMEPLTHCDADDKTSESLVRAKARQRSDSVVGESSSGTELWDGQGTGKKRRATRDVPLPETSCLENHNKRRKIKSKKERSHIDQLLAVSLREEELSRSLQTLDTDLIKARTALEAAYLEVQKLMMVKQQMTTEMSTLRNKRIELLQGMQADSVEGEPRVRVKEEKLDMDEAELHTSSSVPSFTSSAASPAHSARRASPPSSCVPFTPLAIKEEPRSPVHISSGPDADVNTAYCAHSTTPELPTAASVPDPAFNCLPSTETRLEMCQTYSENERDAFGDPIDSKESLAELVRSMQKDIQASRSHAEHYSNDKVPTPSRRDSEMGSLVESAGAPSFETPSVPLEFNVPTSPSELRDGKRVRKLKKRKVLKKAQGTELPESSDTEMDTEASRPRWLHPRRRSSGGSQVSTSTQQTDDRKEDVNMEGVEELSAEKDGLQSVKCTSKEPYVPLNELKLKLDSEESKDVTHLDSSEAEAQNVACHEISSTSDMDISLAAESNVEINLTLPKTGKTSSVVLSDHGDDDDELPTEGTFEGHVEAVNDMQIHNGLLYTCSGDRTVRAFDTVQSHKCVAVFEGHSSKVNALLLSTSSSMQQRLYTGSSDQTIRCYCLKTQRFEQQFSLSDRVLCLHSRWKIMYAGLGNGAVVTFNLRTNKQMDVFECHGPRAVSCLASSQEGARRLLLVGSYDNTISVRDAKNGLLLRTLEGHSKTVLCMKVANDLVFSGSSDQCVHAHNIHTGQLVRVYKGHSHAVSVVSVLGKVMVTACLDKLVRVYDLQSHEQLQVYGGHKDMVMCMTIHKNMIYTGCYDGSVQAVKLNLMQNYPCRWHGCSMVFGLMEHLEHHLTHDHTSANLQTLRCRWKNCEEFLSARNCSKQGILVHMQKHAEEESHVEP